MKKIFGYLLLIVLLYACKKDSPDNYPADYYLASYNYHSTSNDSGLVIYHYDASNKLIGEDINITITGGYVISSNSSFVYGPDGKVKTASSQHDRAEYSRDAQGRVSSIIYYTSTGSSITSRVEYQYFTDRFERKQTDHTGTAGITFKFFYTADKQNYNRIERYDQTGQLLGAEDYLVSTALNPLKLLEPYYGMFYPRNILYPATGSLQVVATTGGYGTKTITDLGFGSTTTNYQLRQ